jgi:hypothetical protein
VSGWNEGAAIAMWREGKSATEIAGYFGLTRNAVCGRLWRMGLKREGAMVRGTRAPAAPKPPRVRKFRVVKPPRPPRVPVAVAPPVVVDIMAARPFMSRTTRECSWILDDGQACCNPAEGGGSYCPGHRAIVYRPTAKPKDYERSLRRYTA